MWEVYVSAWLCNHPSFRYFFFKHFKVLGITTWVKLYRSKGWVWIKSQCPSYCLVDNSLDSRENHEELYGDNSNNCWSYELWLSRLSLILLFLLLEKFWPLLNPKGGKVISHPICFSSLSFISSWYWCSWFKWRECLMDECDLKGERSFWWMCFSYLKIRGTLRIVILRQNHLFTNACKSSLSRTLLPASAFNYRNKL